MTCSLCSQGLPIIGGGQKQYTRKELLSIAKEKGIKGVSKLKKDDILQIIKRNK